MTLVVVAENRILVDTKYTHGHVSYKGTKIARATNFKWSGSGPSGAIALLARFLDYHWTEKGPAVEKPDFDFFGANLVLRDGSGLIWTADAETCGIAVPLTQPAGAPYSYHCGSGAEFFSIFYKQAKDVEAAFKLACLHDEGCGLPMEEF